MASSPDPGAVPASLPSPFAVPAAMARLATLNGRAVPETEGHAEKVYGEAPGRAALARLGDELGLGIRISNQSLSSLPRASFPVIALVSGGGAMIVYRDQDKYARVEGGGGECRIPIAKIDGYFSGLVLIPGETANSPAADAPHTIPGPAEKTTQERENPSLWSWMGQILWRHHRPVVAQLLTAAIISNLFLLSLPLFIMSVYDRVIPHTAFETLQALAIGIALVFIADIGLRFARLKFVDALGVTLARRLQQHLYARLLHLPITKKPKSAAGMQTIQNEVENVSLLAPEVAIGLIADGLYTVGVLLLVMSIGGPVVLGPMIGIAITIAIIVASAKAAKESATETVALRSATSAQISESIDAMVPIKSCGAERSLLDRFERLTAKTAAKAHAQRHRLRFSTNTVAVIVQMTVVLTVIFSVGRISAGAMTIGSMAAITILVGRAVAPVGTLTDQFMRLRAGTKIVSDVFDGLGDEEPNGGDLRQRTVDDVKGAFRIERVSFVHEEAAAPTLNDITLSLKPGERVGIIGKNGCGKSTLLHHFAMLLAPTQGVVNVDGHDARQYGARALRRCIGFMSQDTVLFDRSLYDNIALGLDDVDKEAFARAAMASGADRIAARHPEGFSMSVGPRGEYLSAGERQAVALARVFIRQQNVLVLDEPTSLMDQTAEAHVIESLKALSSSTTIILSTHRLRLLDAVDRVIALDGGRILADGPKAQVLAQLAGKSAA